MTPPLLPSGERSAAQPSAGRCRSRRGWRWRWRCATAAPWSATSSRAATWRTLTRRRPSRGPDLPPLRKQRERSKAPHVLFRGPISEEFFLALCTTVYSRGIRHPRDTRVEYLVEWVGPYPHTWEAADDIHPEWIEAFETAQQSRSEEKSKGQRAVRRKIAHCVEGGGGVSSAASK